MVRSGPGSPGLKVSGRYPNYSTIQTDKNLALRERTALIRALTLSLVLWRECLSQHMDLDPGGGTPEERLNWGTSCVTPSDQPG